MRHTVWFTADELEAEAFETGLPIEYERDSAVLVRDGVEHRAPLWPVSA